VEAEWPDRQDDAAICVYGLTSRNVVSSLILNKSVDEIVDDNSTDSGSPAPFATWPSSEPATANGHTGNEDEAEEGGRIHTQRRGGRGCGRLVRISPMTDEVIDAPATTP
jgi:hypothetical protein